MPLTCYLPNDSLTTIGNKGIYVKKTIRNAIMDESKITSEVIKKFNIIISLLLNIHRQNRKYLSYSKSPKAYRYGANTRRNC